MVALRRLTGAHPMLRRASYRRISWPLQVSLLVGEAARYRQRGHPKRQWQSGAKRPCRGLSIDTRVSGPRPDVSPAKATRDVTPHICLWVACLNWAGSNFTTKTEDRMRFVLSSCTYAARLDALPSCREGPSVLRRRHTSAGFHESAQGRPEVESVRDRLPNRRARGGTRSDANSTPCGLRTPAFMPSR